MNKYNRRLDLTGMRFGKLVALRIVGKRGTNNIWEFLCDCGATHRANTSDLRKGLSSCGCNRTAQYQVDWLITQIAKQSDACIEWPFVRNDQGYGIVRVDGSYEGAHRFAFFLLHGHRPEPCGLHKCDNPPCCNPSHIFEGTRTDNSDDKIRKGRHRCGPPMRGEAHPGAVLNDVKVAQIRAKYIPREHGLKVLAKEYGVSIAVIHNVVSGKTWKHLTQPVGHGG